MVKVSGLLNDCHSPNLLEFLFRKSNILNSRKAFPFYPLIIRKFTLMSFFLKRIRKNEEKMLHLVLEMALLDGPKQCNIFWTILLASQASQRLESYLTSHMKNNVLLNEKKWGEGYDRERRLLKVMTEREGYKLWHREKLTTTLVYLFQ